MTMRFFNIFILPFAARVRLTRGVFEVNKGTRRNYGLLRCTDFGPEQDQELCRAISECVATAGISVGRGFPESCGRKRQAIISDRTQTSLKTESAPKSGPSNREHSDDNEKLPVIPRKMIVDIFIRKKEEQQLGVTAKVTEDYRRDEGVLDSDAIDAMTLGMAGLQPELVNPLAGSLDQLHDPGGHWDHELRWTRILEKARHRNLARCRHCRDWQVAVNLMSTEEVGQELQLRESVIACKTQVASKAYSLEWWRPELAKGRTLVSGDNSSRDHNLRDFNDTRGLKENFKFLRA
ncbi:hypothetical protein B0H10DRAFT_1957556 [Mycena sp. CBHHK59/15]|nr:hypothetical protein B0H10DRAFT_1957556 [Mycena sp. CBHHK59/15]